MTDEHEIDEPEVDAPEIEAEAPSEPARDYEAEARDMGWKPKEEWDGRGEWRDAETFVKRGEELLPIVQARLAKTRAEQEAERKAFDQRLKRIEAANKAAFEAQKRQFEDRQKALEARIRQAAGEGDLETYDALNRQRETLRPPEEPKVEEPAGVAPPVAEWRSRNDWYGTDEVMTAVAWAAAERLAKNGNNDVAAQLEAAEAEVKRRFPERFPQPAKPPVVESGGRSPSGKREKGAADLPAEARSAFKQFVQMGVYKQEDLARYAKAYWEQA